jgi:hypothetical protein
MASPPLPNEPRHEPRPSPRIGARRGPACRARSPLASCLPRRGRAGREAHGPHELLVLGPESARTHHLNLVPVDRRVWREGLAFREALRSSPALACAHNALKRDLAARYASDRAAYTQAKERFILEALESCGPTGPASECGRASSHQPASPSDKPKEAARVRAPASPR